MLQSEVLPKVFWVWQENRVCKRNGGKDFKKRIHFSLRKWTLWRLSLNIIITSLFLLLFLSFSYLSLSRFAFQPRGSVHLSSAAPSSSTAPRVHLCSSSTGSPSRVGAEEHASCPVPTAGFQQQSWTGRQRADAQYLGTEQQHTARDQVKYKHTHICFSIVVGSFLLTSIVLYWGNDVLCPIKLHLNLTFLHFNIFIKTFSF